MGFLDYDVRIEGDDVRLSLIRTTTRKAVATLLLSPDAADQLARRLHHKAMVVRDQQGDMTL